MLTYHSLMWLAQWISDWNLIRNIWPKLVMIMQQKQTKQNRKNNHYRWMKNSKWISSKKRTQQNPYSVQTRKKERKNLWIAICALSKNNTWSDLLVKDMKRAQHFCFLSFPFHSIGFTWLYRVLLYYNGYDT